MPFIPIKEIAPEKLEFFGFNLVGEDDEFCIYEDAEGRVTMADKTNPMIWVDDMSDAIQLGVTTILIRK